VPAFERRTDPNPNANIASAVTISVLPIIEYSLLLSGGFNPAMIAKLPENISKGRKREKTRRRDYSGDQIRVALI
jgi:hypothetical protein